jgi:diguanylate cyclase (GGDEF)-like protein
MLSHDSRCGVLAMKDRAVKQHRKPILPSRPGGPSRHAPADDPAPRSPRAPVRDQRRSVAMQLAAEVDALAAQLETSRSRIAELEARIDIDPLTDVLNRRGFERELKRSLAYVKRYGASAALLYIDLDGFKPVNDRHGHAAGDAVLKTIAAVLVRNVRASDVVARLGGDEFAVLLWNVGGGAAAAKAAALEAAIYATQIRWNASTFVVGASAGIAQLGPLDAPAEVLERADAAMYARKGARARHSGSRIAAVRNP